MPQVFQTKKGGRAIGIEGVGGLAANGGSSLSVEDAAKTMSELQEKDDVGRVILDKDGQPKPLTGAELTKAAKEWAESQDLEVATVKADEIWNPGEDLRKESIRRYKATYAHLKPVNNDPELLATSGADPAAIQAAPENPETAKEG